MDLRDRLFAAIDEGLLERVEELCRTQRDAIVDAFPGWQIVPEAMREDPQALQEYATGLITIARVFAEVHDDPQLLERLGARSNNPLAQWDAELQTAAQEMEELRYTDAGRRLQQLMNTTRELRGSGVEQLRPITLGFIGECMFQQGNADAAVPFFEQALAGVRAIGDASGIAAYTNNLYEVHRYLGDGAAAARYAADLAMLYAMAGRDVDAKRMQSAAMRAREGEPRNRVVAQLEDGTFVELDEVHADGGERVRFSYQRNRVALRRATALVSEGEQLGAAGRFDDALAKFREAAQLDPHFPHARYQEGFTLVLLRRYEEAAAAYATTEELAPGWFHCRADLWMAKQLASGAIDHATFEAMRELEDGPGSAEEKLALAERAIATAPHVPGLHLEHGRQLSRLGRFEEACAAYRAGLAREPDPDIHTRLLVQLAIVVEDKAERLALFERATQLDGNLVAAATARLALRQA